MTRPRLTKHQARVLADLHRYSGARRLWAEARDIGAPAALEHLYAKGYVERDSYYGPRGGEHYRYRPKE